MSATEAKATFTQEAGLGTITLHNPPLNQIGTELIRDLTSAIEQVEQAPALRALLLKGDGQAFSAGAEVQLFVGRGADEMRPLVASFLDLGRRIEALPFPTLAVAHGVKRVAARAGLGRARSIAFGGGLHKAEEFAAWGLIDRVLPAAELDEKAERLARKLADGPTVAYAAIKDIAAAYTRAGIPGADERLLDAAVGLFDTVDAQEGIRSFLESGAGHAVYHGK
jgi:enoyl-CoA hydratase/carnithine racemase